MFDHHLAYIRQVFPGISRTEALMVSGACWGAMAALVMAIWSHL